MLGASSGKTTPVVTADKESATIRSVGMGCTANGTDEIICGVPNEVVYVELLDEGVEVWRPVRAQELQGGLYLLAATAPEDEAWACPPGSRVRCERRGIDLYAVEMAEPGE